MKKLLFIAFASTMCGSALYGMQVRESVRDTPEFKSEMAFITALTNGDIAGVTRLLNAGADVHHFRTVHGYLQSTPVNEVWNGNLPFETKTRIINLLLGKGLQSSELNEFLSPTVVDDNEHSVQVIAWLVSQHAKDIDHRALEYARELLASEPTSVHLREIVRILESQSNR